VVSEFELLVFRYPVDVIHHPRRVFKNVVIDALKKIANLVVLLLSNGDKGVIDMSITVGRGLNETAIDTEVFKNLF
jgi:hypothetical protein